MEYDFKKIEQKWQNTWNFEVKDANYFVLSMWPYPSGKLHMGHLRNYLIGDVIARFKTLKGFKVLHPMGWDAFGLPAENAAMEQKTSPKNWTLENIKNMKEELKKAGFSFDWNKEETSCLPSYYKHEQKMFLEFLKQGIAYKKESLVNWDPVDNTVLANEQVIEGRGWRSGAIVEKRLLSQWFLKISAFSEELLEGLKSLDKWPEKVKIMQENWIGKSEGCEIDFEVEGENDKIKIFTTKPETLFGASFVAISYAHPIALKVKEATDFIKECEKGSTKAEDLETAEKKGFFTGFYAKNPLNDNLLPIYIANFVLPEYGTGALFGCPAHDMRDYEFAIKYNLQVKQVVFEAEPKKKDFLIEEEDFIIRPFKQSDLPELTNMLLELNQNPHWVLKPESEEVVKKEAKRKLEMYINWFEKFGFSRFAVFNKKENKLMGGAGFCFFAPRQNSLEEKAKKTDLELGYWFLKEFHGKGFGGKIIQSLLKWAEENLEFTKIVAVTEPSNEVSQKLLKKYGFTEDGIMHHTEYGDETFFYKILPEKLQKPFTKEGILFNSSFLNGLTNAKARKTMFEKFGKKVNFRLKDWGVSRQRYWGAPIPVINCKKCGIIPLDESELPVTLPEDIKIEPGENPLKKHPTWRFTKCRKCGCDAERETDTLDTFFESSWYFLRFSGNGGENSAFKNPLKVNDYIGGIEHAILHLLYARFFNRALKKCGYDVPFEEPFERLITQGMVCHKTFQTLEGKWLTPEEAAVMPENLYTVGASIKMSKSKKNVIEPATIINKYGADTARFFMGSDNPPERDMEWSDEGVSSSFKFLNKLWVFANSLKEIKPALLSVENLKIMHKIVSSYEVELEAVALNKAIAKIRELSNLMFSLPLEEARAVIEQVTVMILPFCPHIACEIAEILDFKLELLKIEQNLLEDDMVQISVQINGKLRGIIKTLKNATVEEVKNLALQEEWFLRYIAGKEIKKEIYIQNKILSFVI